MGLSENFPVRSPNCSFDDKDIRLAENDDLEVSLGISQIGHLSAS